MSAMGHQRTSVSESGMSALPPKADMFRVESDVCYVPKADLTLLTRNLGALLIAGLDAAQIGHVLELVGGDTGR